jgi:hypothetical protein
VKQLGSQTKAPDHIFVIASSPADIVGLDLDHPHLTIQVGRTGLTLQRNDGLALAGSQFSYIVFFDDDFVPSRFWIERMYDIFESRRDVVGLTGTVLADGTTTAGVPLEEAQAIVAVRDSNPVSVAGLRERFPYGNNVGCNMAFRYSAIRGLAFDEHLPLYAWHEDSDFRAQVAQRGIFGRADSLWGVHLGHKPGRVSGVALGYSQIANAVHLAKKGTVPLRYLAKTAGKNVLINLLRSIRPEPFIDRRGRLRGNAMAIVDLARGEIAPERIMDWQRRGSPHASSATSSR